MSRKTTAAGGTTALELMVSLAILGLGLAISNASLDALYRRMALRRAAERVREVLRQTQGEARSRSSNCAVKFVARTGGWCYAVYQDGNGNGVLNREIDSGTDPQFVSERPLLDEYGVGVGLMPGETDPDGGPPLISPVNFNRSTLCSFSQTGDATPGTIYLTNGTGAAAVRSSDDGTIRILLYVPQSGRWVDL